MKKYNLSKIMKRAWELVREFGYGISEGLRSAWMEEKREVTDLMVWKKAQELVEKFQSSSPYNVVLSRKEWEVPGHSRVYYTINFYKKGRNSKKRDAIHLGYFDKLNKKYVLADKWDKDVFAL